MQVRIFCAFTCMTNASLFCPILFDHRYQKKMGCCLQPEIDGLRVITNRTSEFMHRVTSECISIVFIHVHIQVHVYTTLHVHVCVCNETVGF